MDDEKIKCRTTYCLYNERQECTMDYIEINDLGMCDYLEMTYVNYYFLERAKASKRKDKEKRLEKVYYGRKYRKN